MATLDFTPIFRSSVGFDRLPGMLSDAIARTGSGYPPYNIEKCGEDRYRIILALAGFTREDVEIVLEHNRLFVRGKIKDRNASTYLHRGIASRPFERQFDLADFIEVTGATMGEGLLVIDLKRELPEALKPRSIPINAGTFVNMHAKSAGETGGRLLCSLTGPYPSHSRTEWTVAMRDQNSMLEPFELETLETIRSAFQAGWHELCNAAISSDPYALRNRLARTIASLARGGISDPLELKSQALRNLNASASFN